MSIKLDYVKGLDIDYGAGYDSLAAIFHTVSCIEGLPAEPTRKEEKDLETLYSLKQIDSDDSLEDELDVSAQGSLDMGIFKGGCKASFTRQVSQNSHSLFLLGHVTVTGNEYGYMPADMEHVTINAETKRRFFINNDLDGFRRKHGDYFVTGINYGGELIFMYEIVCVSEEERQDVSASADAEGGKWSAAGAMTDKIQRLSSKHTVNIWAYDRGTCFTPDKITPDSLIKLLNNFSGDIAAGKGSRMSIALTPYSDLVDFTLGTADLTAAQNDLDELSARVTGYRRIKADIEYALKYPVEFIWHEDSKEKLSDLKNVLLDAISFACATAKDRSDHPSGASLDWVTLSDPEDGKLREVDFYQSRFDSIAKRNPNLPSCAADIVASGASDSSQDGDHTLYLDGDYKRKVTMYCKDMRTGSPKEYLALPRHDGNSNCTFIPAVGYCTGENVLTAFEKIRLDPKTMLVDLYDYNFSEQLGGTAHWTDAEGKSKMDYSRYPYGCAWCSLGADDYGKHQYGTANIDLSDTPFQVDPLVDYVFETHENTGADCGVKMEDPASRQKFNIRVQGSSGKAYPTYGGKMALKLRFME